MTKSPEELFTKIMDFFEKEGVETHVEILDAIGPIIGAVFIMAVPTKADRMRAIRSYADSLIELVETSDSLQ